jgi:tetratricopeptide (TPR) repeat protein
MPDFDDLAAFAFLGVFAAGEGLGVSNSTGRAPEVDAALEAAALALRRDPTNPKALFTYGYALQARQQFGAAAAVFFKLLKADPNHARAWLLFSECLTETGQYEPARKARQKALELDPRLGR